MRVHLVTKVLSPIIIGGFLIGAAGQIAKIVIPEDRAATHSVSAMNKAELVGA
ncbi:hypothetical protein [Streptomyces sp. NPDC020965]|uniref:hypothetical protein n=1 Tax=Streptomyces sp. NPDC020965 TaxID=3365105 RepID=UPI003787A00A